MSRSVEDHLTEEILHEYLDGELDSEDKSTVQRHLKGCTDCTDRLETWRALFVEIEQLPDLEDVINFEPIVLADLTQRVTRRNWVTWMILGQVAMAISLLAYGWQRIAAFLPLEQISGWLSLPIQIVQGMTDSLMFVLAESFNQFLFWSFPNGDPIMRFPQIANGGTLLIYLGLLVVVLWIVGNHYLLRVNGQTEDARPQY
jgi:hypothetical protein